MGGRDDLVDNIHLVFRDEMRIPITDAQLEADRTTVIIAHLVYVFPFFFGMLIRLTGLHR